jgi:hypothetical protein
VIYITKYLVLAGGLKIVVEYNIPKAHIHLIDDVFIINCFIGGFSFVNEQ